MKFRVFLGETRSFEDIFGLNQVILEQLHRFFQIVLLGALETQYVMAMEMGV